MEALIETDFQGGGADERETRAMTQAAGAQIHDQGHECRRNVFNKARLTDQAWEFRAPGSQNLIQIVGFEVSIMRLMIGNQYGHDLTDRHVASGR